MKLIKCEEIAFIQHILDLNSKEFSSTKEAVQDMTNHLLKKRDENLVDHH
jgi:hypothetical protein